MHSSSGCADLPRRFEILVMLYETNDRFHRIHESKRLRLRQTQMAVRCKCLLWPVIVRFLFSFQMDLGNLKCKLDNRPIEFQLIKCPIFLSIRIDCVPVERTWGSKMPLWLASDRIECCHCHLRENVSLWEKFYKNQSDTVECLPSISTTELCRIQIGSGTSRCKYILWSAWMFY